MHRLKNNTQVPGTNSYLLMNITSQGFGIDWCQRIDCKKKWNILSSVFRSQGFRWSMDGLVNGKHAETTTIPRPVREDKRRSESELQGKMVPTSGLFRGPQRDRWWQSQLPLQAAQLAPGGWFPGWERWKLPQADCMSQSGPSAKKNSISSWLQDPPPAAGISSLILEEIDVHCWLFYLYVFYTFMFIKGLNFKYL